MLLTFACLKGFKLYQMNIKSEFLNGYIMDEVYVEQPSGFENFLISYHVYKLDKALYGLKQVSRAWYIRLTKFNPENNFSNDKVESTLFTKRHKITCL